MARVGHGAAVVRWMVVAGLAGALVTVRGAARAQTLPSIDMRTWRPSPDADASLVLEPTTTAGSWRWNLGAWAQYGLNSVVYRNRGDQKLRAVANFVGIDFTGGIGLGDRARSGSTCPCRSGKTATRRFR